MTLPAFGPRSPFFPRASTLRRDRISAASMGPAGKLINIRQGEGSIEEYAGRFWEVARRSATEKTCLLVFFWGGLAEPLRARMPYWNPEESLEGYLNLALRLSDARPHSFRSGGARSHSSRSSRHNDARPYSIRSGGSRPHSSRSSQHGEAHLHSSRSGGVRPHR